MADVDTVARAISVVSAGIALGSLWVAVLSYRRGRPRVVVKEAGVVTASIWRREGLGDGGRDVDVLLVQARLVNRGQAKVQLAAGAQPDRSPVAVEFQPSRAWYERWRRGSPAVKPGMLVPVAHRSEHDQVDAFAGLSISGELADKALIKASTDGLTRIRLRITLSTGDVITSGWLPTSAKELHAQLLARRQLRLDAPEAMADLTDAVLKTAGLRPRGAEPSDDVVRTLLRRKLRFEPTWKIITEIIKQLEDWHFGGQPLEEWRKRWGASLDAAMSDEVLRESR